MRTQLLKTLATALALAVAAPAAAAPILWSGNGHYYEAVSANINFGAALAAADAASFMGEGGYLATITSADENAFVQSVVAAHLGSARSVFLGGSDEATEGVWTWVSGPEAGQVFYRHGIGVEPGFFAPWHGSEPNNSGGEDALAGYYFGGATWNDVCTCSGVPQIYGYVVEYGGELSGAVPEPGAWALMILGFGAAGSALRRRRPAPVSSV